jgi:hypothetical protein
MLEIRFVSLFYYVNSRSFKALPSLGARFSSVIRVMVLDYFFLNDPLLLTIN